MQRMEVQEKKTKVLRVDWKEKMGSGGADRYPWNMVRVRGISGGAIPSCVVSPQRPGVMAPSKIMVKASLVDDKDGIGGKTSSDYVN